MYGYPRYFGGAFESGAFESSKQEPAKLPNVCVVIFSQYVKINTYNSGISGERNCRSKISTARGAGMTWSCLKEGVQPLSWYPSAG